MRNRRFTRTGAQADMVHEVDRLCALVAEVLSGSGSDTRRSASGIVVYRAFDRTSRTRGALLRHRLAHAGVSCTMITPSSNPGLPANGAARTSPAAVLVDVTGASGEALRWSALDNVPLIRLGGTASRGSVDSRQPQQTATALVWVVEHPLDDAGHAARGAALQELAVGPHPGAATRLSVRLENTGTEIAVPCPPHTGLHLRTRADGLAVSTPPDPTSIGNTRTDVDALVTTAGGLAQMHADTRVVLAIPAGSRLRVHARTVEVLYA